MSGWGTIYNQTQYSLKTWSESLARLQEQASSGARVVRASDEPGTAYQILSLRDTQNSVTTYTSNINEIQRRYKDADSALQSTQDIVAQVRQLVSQAASGAMPPETRTPIGQQIDAMLEQAVQLANDGSLGSYTFGGADMVNPPYQAVRENGQIVRVDYVGSLQNTQVPVGPGVQYTGTLVGDRIFRSNRPGQITFYGNSGVTPGSGTPSVRGDAWLTLTHDTTSFDSSTGLAAGTSSAADDTILGDHNITIDALAKTIKLDNGAAVTFDGSETDLELTNSNGDKVHVDMTAWTGAEGTTTVSATGLASLDDGATTTAITRTDNLAVTDSRTGQVLYINTTGIQRTGTEPGRVSGSYDLFSELASVRDLLTNTRGLDQATQLKLLSESEGSLQEVSTGVVQGLTLVGGKIQAMDTLQTSLQNVTDNAKSQADQLQDADIISVATELARTQTLYQMTLTSAAKLLQMNLLDYI